LVLLTEKLELAYEAAMRLQAPWINELADGLSLKNLETAGRVLAALRKKFEATEWTNGPDR
jgi:hypothetical protein